MNSEQSVIISFQYGIEELDPLYALVNKLTILLEGKNIGDCDGHEIAMDNSDGSLYLYGPNAEVLFKAIKSTLESTSFLKGATAQLRFGASGNDVPEIEVVIGDD
jgi:hypothetical protein